MNRYWLFAGYQYYPSGGMHDFKDSFEMEDGARIRFHEKFSSCDWAHIVDIETGNVVAAWNGAQWI